MMDFLKAAFPWMIMGIAVAVFAANHIRGKKQADDQDKKKDEGNRQAEGMSIGMCMGVLFGTTGICDLATGISLGMLLGLVIGMSIKK